MGFATTQLAMLGLLAQILTEPLPIPTRPASLLWVIPIGLSSAIVYKAVKLERITAKVFIREVLLLFVTGIGLLVVAAVVLLVIAESVR